jgi:sirohydrochlorin cobaltochelatase
MTGLLLFAHGARDPQWAVPFQAVAERVRAQRPQVEVRLGFLELMQPDIATAAAQLIANGCTRIEVLPLFLGAGGHVRKDLPALLSGLQQAHPDVAFTLQRAVGEMPALIDAMAGAAIALLPD